MAAARQTTAARSTYFEKTTGEVGHNSPDEVTAQGNFYLIYRLDPSVITPKDQHKFSYDQPNRSCLELPESIRELTLLEGERL